MLSRSLPFIIVFVLWVQIDALPFPILDDEFSDNVENSILYPFSPNRRRLDSSEDEPLLKPFRDSLKHLKGKHVFDAERTNINVNKNYRTKSKKNPKNSSYTPESVESEFQYIDDNYNYDSKLEDSSKPTTPIKPSPTHEPETVQACSYDPMKKHKYYTQNFNFNSSTHNIEPDFRINGDMKMTNTHSVHEGKDITLCWIETTTIKEDKTLKPTARLVFREFSITFENSAAIPNEHLDCSRYSDEITRDNERNVCNSSYDEVIDEDTLKSKTVNFTTVTQDGSIEVTTIRRTKCAMGSSVTKDITKWLNGSETARQRVEVKVSPSTFTLDEYCSSEDCVDNVTDTTTESTGQTSSISSSLQSSITQPTTADTTVIVENDNEQSMYSTTELNLENTKIGKIIAEEQIKGAMYKHRDNKVNRPRGNPNRQQVTKNPVESEVTTMKNIRNYTTTTTEILSVGSIRKQSASTTESAVKFNHSKKNQASPHSININNNKKVYDKSQIDFELNNNPRDTDESIHSVNINNNIKVAKKPRTVETNEDSVNDLKSNNQNSTLSWMNSVEASCSGKDCNSSVSCEKCRNNTNKTESSITADEIDSGSCDCSKESESNETESSTKQDENKIITTEPTFLTHESRLKVLENITTTAETRRSTSRAKTIDKPMKINNKQFSLRIQVSLEQINENKENRKLAEVDRNLTLHGNLDEHGNQKLLKQLEALNNSANNIEVIKRIFNCSALANLSETSRDNDGDHYRQRRHAKIVGNDKNNPTTDPKAIKECVAGFQSDLKAGLIALLSQLSNPSNKSNQSSISGTKDKPKATASANSIPIESKGSSRPRRSVVNGHLSDELNRWSNERFIRSVDGEKLRSLTKLTIVRNSDDGSQIINKFV